MLNFDDGRDFPFYNENPRMSRIDGQYCDMHTGFINFLSEVNSYANEFLASMVFLLVMMVLLLYFFNWDYTLFLKGHQKTSSF